MRQGMMQRLSRLIPRMTSIRDRLFMVLFCICLATSLVINLVWLPGALHDIRDGQAALQRVLVYSIRDRIQLILDGREEDLRTQARLIRAAFLAGNHEALQQLAYRFLQHQRYFGEFGILDADGRERLRISRFLTITDGDLTDRSDAPFYSATLRGEVYWGPVTTSETSEPEVTLAVPLEGANASRIGVNPVERTAHSAGSVFMRSSVPVGRRSPAACVPCMRSCSGVQVPCPGVRGAEGPGKRQGVLVRGRRKAAWNEGAGRGTRTR
jgi:hypothetical protein